MGNEFVQGENIITNFPNLLTSIQLHLVLYTHYFMNKTSANKKVKAYNGIIMVDDIDYEIKFKGRDEYRLMVRERMKAYEEYIKRGGIMIEDNVRDWNWLH